MYRTLSWRKNLREDEKLTRCFRTDTATAVRLATCQTYIHALRWKDQLLQCPQCQSQDVDPWGNYPYRPGCKRSWCNGCQRTFNDLTDTLLHQSKRSLPYWILATFLLCLSCSSRRIARELGVHGRTSSRWCWWLRNTAVSYETDRQVEGTVEADDLYHTAGQKGQARQGGKKVLGRRKPRQNIVYLSAELNRLCWIRVSTDISIRGLPPVGGLILPRYSVVAHRNATLWVQSIYFRTSVKDPLARFGTPHARAPQET